MAIHHPILCTFRLWSTSLQVASPRALHLECKSSGDKFITTQKLGAVPTPSRHRNKHDTNIVKVGPTGEGKNKGKHPMHPFAPRPTSGGSGDPGRHRKGTPAHPFTPIYHHTDIDRHLWESHSAKLPDDIEGSLERNQLFVDTKVKLGDGFNPRDSEGLKEVPASARPKKGGGYGVLLGAPPKPGGHQLNKTIIYIDKLMGEGVPQWFIQEMLNELRKCWPDCKNSEWTMKDRPIRIFKDIEDEVYSDREKMKVVQQASQSEMARNRQLEEEVQHLRAKQAMTLELVSKLQADMVARDQQERPRSPSPPSPQSHPITIPPNYPPQ